MLSGVVGSAIDGAPTWLVGLLIGLCVIGLVWPQGVLKVWGLCHRLGELQIRSPVAFRRSAGTGTGIIAETPAQSVERERKSLQKYVFIGPITCDFENLSEHNTFELWVLIFNGTLEMISIRDGPSGIVSLDRQELDSLPRIQNPENLKDIDRGQERSISLMQRVPSELAQSIAEKLGRGEKVDMRLKKLTIEIESSVGTRHRLAFPDGLYFGRTISVMGKIVEASASVKL